MLEHSQPTRLINQSCTSYLNPPNNKLEKIAQTDQLTDLLNRFAGDAVLNYMTLQAMNRAIPFSLITCDVDHFKSVNDTYGHPAGDRILVNVARQIKSVVRSGDYCIRWGGEEFIIVLPGCSLSVAVRLAERIRCEIADLNDEEVGPVTMSFGVGERMRPETPDLLIARVDQALYRAKEAGRNRVEPT